MIAFTPGYSPCYDTSSSNSATNEEHTVTSGYYVELVLSDDDFEEIWERREKVKWPAKKYPKPVQTRLLKRRRFYSGFVSEARGRHLVVKLNNSRCN